MKRLAGLLIALTLLPAALQAQLIAYDYSKLYELSKPAIVTVTTDDGSGSGFVVTQYGHIATNFHVVRNSRYLAVQFSDGTKVKAAVVAVNPHYDMALLKVNSSLVKHIRPLPILPAEKEVALKVGIPVVAIGSPLNQKFLMTQGILSKVDDMTVLGDFLLQAGNSGGPLLNCDGEVIGINTFGEANIGGAIRVAALRDFVNTPGLIQESAGLEPPASALPAVSAVRYPIEILNQKVESEPLDWTAYRIKAGDFNITAVTPVLIAKLQVMQQKLRASNRFVRRTHSISDPSYHSMDEPYYEWHRATESSLDYAITFDVRPESGPTKQSRTSKLLSPLWFLKTGKPEMEFKAEFLDLRIYRDGELIEPIMPGRQVIEGNSDHGKSTFVDQAYAGSYQYSPDEFLTGKEFRIQIIDARTPNVVHKEIIFTESTKLIRQLRGDFTYNPALMIVGAVSDRPRSGGQKAPPQ